MVGDTPADLLTNTTSIVGLLLVIGYVGKQVIEWFRGNKSLEHQWKSTAINDAIAGHTVLKEMFDSLKVQIEELENDLRDSKRREAEAVAAHRAEMASMRRRHTEEIEELQSQVRQLQLRLEEYEQRES